MINFYYAIHSTSTLLFSNNCFYSFLFRLFFPFSFVLPLHFLWPISMPIIKRKCICMLNVHLASVQIDRHYRLLHATAEDKPKVIVLSVVVLEAEGLEAKDANGK